MLERKSDEVKVYAVDFEGRQTLVAKVPKQNSLEIEAAQEALEAKRITDHKNVDNSWLRLRKKADLKNRTGIANDGQQYNPKYDPPR